MRTPLNRWALGLILVAPFWTAAQSTNIDSLLKRAATQPADTQQVRTLLRIAEYYRWTKPDSGIYYAQAALQKNETLKGPPRFNAFAWNSIGYASYMQGKYPEAMQAFQKYYEFSSKAGDKINMAFARNNEANIHIELGEYPQALDKHKSALEIRQQAHDSSGIAMSYNNIGFIYKDIGDYDRALDNFFYALRQFEKLNDVRAVAKTHNYIAIVYRRKKEYDKAIEHLQQGIRIQEASKDWNELAISYQTLGSVFSERKQYNEARAAINKSMEIYERTNDVRQIAMVASDLGRIFLDQAENDSARVYFNRSITLNQQMGNLRNLASPFLGLAQAQTRLGRYAEAGAALDSARVIVNETNRKDDRKYLYEASAEYYAATGNLREALRYQQLFSVLKDTLLNEANLKAMADMEVKYETEKKEQEILLQQAEIGKKNIIIWAVSGVFILILLLGISMYRRYRLKQQARLRDEIIRQQELATRAVIKAEEDERQRIARDLHDGVGQMMSAAKMNLSAFEANLQLPPEQLQSFDRIIGLVDESCKEIRAVSHNMMPNALLKNSLASAVRDFIDKIDKRALQVHIYTEGLDERLDSNVETVLYRVVQECVNNVIKHSGATTLDISIAKDKDGISATIEDNGKGFAVTDQSKFEGIGLKNILTRIQYLKGTVDFDTSPGRGTLVAIHVPL